MVFENDSTHFLSDSGKPGDSRDLLVDSTLLSNPAGPSNLNFTHQVIGGPPEALLEITLLPEILLEITLSPKILPETALPSKIAFNR